MDECIKSGLLFLKRDNWKENGYDNNRVGTEKVMFGTVYHPAEVLTSLVALDLIGNMLDEETKWRIVELLRPKNDDGPLGPNYDYKIDELSPDDADVNAYFMYMYLKEGFVVTNKRVMDVARRLLRNVNDDGVILAYLNAIDERDTCVDANACCNVLRFIYTVGLGEEAIGTEDYLFNFLESKKYLEPSLEFLSPDVFLFFLTRAVFCSAKAQDRFMKPLTEAIKGRLCATVFPVDISARILTLDALGLLKEDEIKDEVVKEQKTLMALQGKEGNFEEDCLFQKNRCTTFFGGSAISTVFAVAALNCFIEQECEIYF